MDILTTFFVLLLFGAALFLTLAVRRDFIDKEYIQRERPTRHPFPRRKP
jgi:hypothetical protein